MYIEINGKDFTPYYIPKTMRLTERTGTDRASSAFDLADCPEPPQEEEEFIVYDLPSKANIEGAGRIKRVKQKGIGSDDKGGVTNGALDEKLYYEIETYGYENDIITSPSTAQEYDEKTCGFIFRDTAQRLPGKFNFSAVPITGKLLHVFETHQKNPGQIFDFLATQMGFQWWVDRYKILHFEDQTFNPAPFVMTDATYQYIAGKTLEIEPDSDNLANQLKIFFKEVYSGGQVNVNNSLDQITGEGTQWLQHVRPGSTFQISNPDINPDTGLAIIAAYTVQSVLSDNLITLSSEYAENTQSEFEVIPNGPVDYIITNIPSGTIGNDFVSQNLLAKLRGKGNGIVAALLPDPGGSNDFAQIKDYLTGELKLRANPNINISFKSTNFQVPGYLTAGMMVRFSLTKRALKTNLQIRQLDKKDTGAILKDGTTLWELTFKFEVKLYDLANKLRRLQEDVYTAQTDETTVIDDVLGAFEPIAFTEISRIIPPVVKGEGVTIGEVSRIGAEFAGPFVWAGLIPGPSGSSPATWSRSWWEGNGAP